MLIEGFFFWGIDLFMMMRVWKITYGSLMDNILWLFNEGKGPLIYWLVLSIFFIKRKMKNMIFFGIVSIFKAIFDFFLIRTPRMPDCEPIFKIKVVTNLVFRFRSIIAVLKENLIDVISKA